jgi:formate C-acetyltransferase
MAPLRAACRQCASVSKCSSSARGELAKCLLYAINGGRDEVSGEQIAPPSQLVQGDYLEFDDVISRFETMMDWLAGVYVNAMNIIHYMHDKCAY